MKNFLYCAGSVLLLVAILALPFVLRPYSVLGDSMYPTLKNGEVMVVDTLSLHIVAPRRGELLVFRNPHHKLQGDSVEIDVKRIIGLPGETVHVREYSVSINDTVYGPATLLGGGADGRNGNEFDMQLGPYDYFVLGDNRRDSSDSRLFGAVQAENFIGRAWHL